MSALWSGKYAVQLKLRIIISVCILSMLGTMQGFSVSQNASSRLTLAGAATPTPTVSELDKSVPSFSIPFACPKTMKLNKGHSWRNITIGESTLSDLQDLYGFLAGDPMYRQNPFLAPTYSLTLTAEASRDRALARSVDACIVDRKIAALLLDPIHDAELPVMLRDWLIKYSAPSIVTFARSFDWGYRTLVWPNEGVGLIVDLRATNIDRDAVYTVLVAFFPPAQSPDDLNGWPYAGLLRSSPTLINDGYPAAMNPFDFEAMIGTSTPQPTPAK